MLPTAIRRATDPIGPRFDFANNPYKSRSTWPPDFDKLSPKQQFRYERTYRRRTKLKWARPTWTKVTTIVQWATIISVLGYGVFAMDTTREGREEQPFKTARDWWRRTADSLWTASNSSESRAAIEQAREYANAREARQQR